MMERWYLKIRDGSVFGPINLATLREWASQGRISPDDAVSTDGALWQSPHEVAELEMHWIVEIPGGTTYGPINIGVIALFLDEGRIPPDANVVDTTTGTKQSAHSITHPPPAPDNGATKRLEEANVVLRSRVDELDQRCLELENQLDSSSKRLADNKQLRSLEEDRYAKSERELRSTIERLERNAIESTRRLEKMREKLNQAQTTTPAKVDWMSSQPSAPSPAPPEPGPDKIEMAKREAELLQQIDRLNTDADVAASRIAEFEKALRTHRRDHENLRLRGINRAAEDKKKLVAAAEEAQTLQQQIQTMSADANKAEAHAAELQTQIRDRQREHDEANRTRDARIRELEATCAEAEKREDELKKQVTAMDSAAQDAAARLADVEKQLTDQQQAHEERTSAMARQASQLEEKANDALARAAESEQRERELAHRIEAEATAADAIQKQLIDLRGVLDQERSNHAAHLDESQRQATEHAQTVEQLQLACGELATQLNEVRERAAEETATLKQGIEEAISREERLHQTLEEMDKKLQSELVHPEVLPKDQDTSSPDTPPAPNISDIEDQLQRELHQLKHKQTEEGGSIGSILSSWKRKD